MILGSADRLGDTLRDNLHGDISKLGGAFDGLRTEVLTGMDASLRTITQTLTAFVNNLREWVSENPELTQTLVLVTAALVALTGAVGVASLAVSFYVGPFAKLRLAIQNIGLSSITATSSIAGLNLVLSGLRVILATLLGVPGLIALGFIAAGLIIWKFWEPIKAFFGGFLSGVWEGLTPLRNAFSAMAPVFSALGNGVKAVWEWFKNLLSPMQTSKDTLDKCASAGETFGRVMGTALSVLLWPLQQLMNGVDWLLKKLDLIPDRIDKAGQQADKAQRDLEASAVALSGHQLPLAKADVYKPADGDKPPVITGVQGHLKTSIRIPRQRPTTRRKSAPAILSLKTCRVLWRCVAPIRRRGLFRSLCRACLRLRPAACCRYRRRHRGDVCAGRRGFGCSAVLPAGL